MRYVPPGTGCRVEEPKTRMRTGALIHAILGRSCHTYWADSMAGGPGIAHRLLVVVDLCITGRMIGQEQKRTLTTFFDFSDVTLAFEYNIKDWPNGWKCNLCDNIFNSDHRHSAHRDRSHRGRYRTVWYSMIKSIDFLSSFFKQVSHVIKIGGKSDT